MKKELLKAKSMGLTKLKSLKKQVIDNETTEQSANQQDQMKKMMEIFSVINSGIEENKVKKRKPLETIEVGKTYIFSHERSASSKKDKLEDVCLQIINNLNEYYEYLSESYFNEYEDDSHTGGRENYIKQGTSCLVCDIIMRRAVYSKLYKKILNDENDKNNLIILMINNKFYMLESKVFKEFAEELTENQ